jgi:ribosome-binding factor A
VQTIRKRKIESLLRETIGLMVLRGEIKDPRINQMVTITDADIAQDMRDAKIYVSVLSEDKSKDEIISTLNHAAGFIQKLLAQRIRLRNTPRLTFYRDDSLERGFQLSQVLKTLDTNEFINNDQEPKNLDLSDSNPKDLNRKDLKP